jgi:hypothetical protein
MHVAVLNLINDYINSMNCIIYFYCTLSKLLLIQTHIRYENAFVLHFTGEKCILRNNINYSTYAYV